ncbi:hypothetical protein DL769_002275 [Monosporascus sp. CRB-8-3]|nr:hypothetical protein DL769_002275 [Monosporascus sp. CRB-8-3]
MPPKQTTAASRRLGSTSASTAAGPSRPKPTSSSSRTTQKPAKASRVANSDLSDLDVFAEDAEEEEGRAPRQKQQQRRQRPRAKGEGAMDVDETADDGAEDDGADDDDAPETIPPDLLTRLLHEFFEKEGTRISRDANAAVAKYMDIFVRETIARTAVEKESGFLEVEDLEKVAPQLLLDL